MESQRAGRLTQLSLPGLAIVQAGYLATSDWRRQPRRAAAAAARAGSGQPGGAGHRPPGAGRVARALERCPAGARRVFEAVYLNPELSYERAGRPAGTVGPAGEADGVRGAQAPAGRAAGGDPMIPPQQRMERHERPEHASADALEAYVLGRADRDAGPRPGAAPARVRRLRRGAGRRGPTRGGPGRDGPADSRSTGGANAPVVRIGEPMAIALPAGLGHRPGPGGDCRRASGRALRSGPFVVRAHHRGGKRRTGRELRTAVPGGRPVRGGPVCAGPVAAAGMSLPRAGWLSATGDQGDQGDDDGRCALPGSCVLQSRGQP